MITVFGRAASDRRLLHDFLKDILAPAELKEIALRWQIVKQLNREVPQWDIAKNLRVAVSTVGRGARMLLNEEGGFNRILKRYYSRR
ncbi:hypothetical protein A3I40_01215 [Candidatus Uhrbacteria bacterium RIFCSPLOWO2_02_FULL_48_12]|uniref:Transcriptional regulator n=1 Tax=Candidatus Uhrbacteria bacterium RIFCSPLOWO2_02_FULL_48_12 TaxID=1802407 RepID=A0A1F7VB46_9BACT|nr:MAG: hypothetical protein A3I40_01215 [Candidatus Uhrbacteria bacterium RIFCSPLOWO2_02_FULL_48_12]